MKTATKKQFVKRCEELGVKYINNGFCIIIEPPHQKVFTSHGNHSDTIHFNPTWKMGEIYAELLHTMEDGVEDCNDPYCEVCKL